MTEEQLQMAELLNKKWQERCANDENYYREQMEKLSKVNQIILTVGGYIQGNYNCVVMDEHCINCDITCEWNMQDFTEEEEVLPIEDRFPWKDWLPYRVADAPNVYYTDKFQKRIRQKFLINAFNDKRFSDTAKVKAKIKADLKAAGLDIYIVNLKMLLCNRGRSAVLTIISKY